MVHHVVPRSKMFVPTDENCPFPVKCLDVTRRTYTDLENKAEAEVEDIWTDAGPKELSDSWRGKTVFTILRPPCTTWIQVGSRKMHQGSGDNPTRPYLARNLVVHVQTEAG